MYGVADESLTCPFFMPLLVAFRRISSKRATKFSGRKHACALAITCVMGDKSNVPCNNIIMLASFSATCVCVKWGQAKKRLCISKHSEAKVVGTLGRLRL